MKHIVIVDDDPAVLYAFTLVFNPNQYQVTVYANGNAILKNEAPIPDLYILDKQLSGIDGLDICRYLKGHPATSQVAVIVLSASPNIGMLADRAGASAFLEKPFSVNDLRALVEKFLE